MTIKVTCRCEARRRAVMAQVSCTKKKNEGGRWRGWNVHSKTRPNNKLLTFLASMNVHVLGDANVSGQTS